MYDAVLIAPLADSFAEKNALFESPTTALPWDFPVSVFLRRTAIESPVIRALNGLTGAAMTEFSQNHH
ncbi:MAG: hypothetical protein ACSHXW_17260 [Yoonia sp.]